MSDTEFVMTDLHERRKVILQNIFVYLITKYNIAL